MKRLAMLVALFCVGCDVVPPPSPTPNPNIDAIADWEKVECPKCDGEGQVYIDKSHPLHEAGYPVGWITCDYCDGDKFMLTNGRGAYTRLRK